MPLPTSARSQLIFHHQNVPEVLQYLISFPRVTLHLRLCYPPRARWLVWRFTYPAGAAGALCIMCACVGVFVRSPKLRHYGGRYFGEGTDHARPGEERPPRSPACRCFSFGKAQQDEVKTNIYFFVFD